MTNYELAKKALNNHQIIAFPTETVFGLGIFYDDEQAYEKMNIVKKKRDAKPYTMMMASIEHISQYGDVPARYRPIIEKYMPGPLTILVKAKPHVPSFVTHDTGVVGVRIPNDPKALELLQYLNKPLLVPSANRAGQKPAMNSDEVKAIFGDEVAIIIPGQAKSGQPSTVIDLTGEHLKIVRPGPIRLEQLLECLL